MSSICAVKKFVFVKIYSRLALHTLYKEYQPFVTIFDQKSIIWCRICQRIVLSLTQIGV